MNANRLDISVPQSQAGSNIEQEAKQAISYILLYSCCVNMVVYDIYILAMEKNGLQYLPESLDCYICYQ